MQERSFDFCIKLIKTPVLSALKKDNNSCQTLSPAAVEIFFLYKEISCIVSSSFEKFILKDEIIKPLLNPYKDLNSSIAFAMLLLSNKTLSKSLDILDYRFHLITSH